MSVKQQLAKFEKSMDVIRSITRAFEHTATQKLVINKNQIEKIDKHLREVKQTYVNAKISIARPKQAGQMMRSSVRKVNHRKVVILVTSEPKYYGNLLPTMVASFAKEVSTPGTDAILIGKPGKEEFDKINRRRIKYTYYDFSDDAPDWKIVGTIGDLISQYSQINIIFGKFQSILTQDVLNENIAADVVNVPAYEAKKYLIRPEPVSALTFLEKQIIVGKLLSKLYENGLAKSAIRIRILEVGEIAQKLAQSLEKFKIYKRKVIRLSNNRKQVSLYSSANIWKNESIFTIYR